MASSDAAETTANAALLEAAPPSLLALQQTTNENVRNLKRKVISVTKLMEVFKNKEKETALLKQQLEDAQKEIKALQGKPSSDTSTEMETEMLGGFAEKQAQLTEQAKIEVEQAKAKQKLAEESLARQTQKLRAIEMLNTQLEAKGINFDKIKGEMTELQKKLTSAQKELEQVSRRSKQESSELRAKLMKAEADMGNRHEWLSQQKERWEREEESKRGNQTKELQQRINELEQQLEDSGTERYLEIEMAKEERKNSEDKLRNANEKLDDANSKIKSLQHTIMELRLKNSTLERKIDTLEHEVNTQTLNNTEVEEFEEIVPDSISARTPVAKKVDRPTIHPTMQSMSLSNLSRDRLDHALSVIDDLKSQLTLVRLFSDGQNHKQGLVALTEQVKILTKEKQALQDELTRRLLDFNNQRSSGSSIQSASVLSHQMTKHPSRLDEAKTPTSADTIARTNSALPKKTARKRKQTENITNYDTHPAADSSLSPMDQNFNMDDIDTITGGGSPSSSLIDSNIKKRSRSSEPSVVPTSGTKPKKARAGRKATKTTSTDLSHIQIRNISVNPVTPSIAVPRHYFSLLMNSAIVDDSQPYTKLEAIARILPEKLSDFFETVQSKAKDIIATVSGYRRELDIMQDSTRSWELDGFEPIVITESLHLSEVYIVQLVCLLQARFSEIDILHKFFITMGEFILKSVQIDEEAERMSVLIRIVTGVARAQDDIESIRIIAYDILREIPKARPSLVLCESIASVWPSVFKPPPNSKEHDLEWLMLKAFQAVLGTHQEAIKSIEIPFGYDTFTRKCSWPALADAPFIDELVNAMMSELKGPTFTENCRACPRYEFSFRKALELLLVHGYEGVEIFNDFIKPYFLKMMIDESLHTFAMPLVAALLHEARFGSPEDNRMNPVVDVSSIRNLLEAILVSEAQLSHQSQSAMAIIGLSSGQEEHLSKAKAWHNNLSKDERAGLPLLLQEVLL